MLTVSFDDLVAALPAGIPPSDQEGTLRKGQTKSGFVQPQLTAKGERCDSPAVILVSAPGAVGKSTLADALADALNAPYWDASMTQVGSHTFSGMLMESYSPPRLAGVITSISTGTGCLVIDALDEAQMRAGGKNFDAFLDNIVGMIKSASGPSLIIFGRVETIDWVRFYLEENDVACLEYGINFFDKEQAHTFVDFVLDQARANDGKAPVHRQHEKGYLETRETLFDLFFDALSAEGEGDSRWDLPEVRQFLGYAPVLQSLAAVLDVTDWQVAKNEISKLRQRMSYPGHVRHGKLLLDIVSQLAERERKKVVGAVEPTILASNPACTPLPSDLYGLDEQLARCLRGAYKLPVVIETSLDASAKHLYEEHIAEQVEMHPFRGEGGFANVVFREAAIAWALIDGSEEVKESLWAAHVSSQYRPTHILARCLAAMLADREDSRMIRAKDFGLIYESATAPVMNVKSSAPPFLEITDKEDGSALAQVLVLDEKEGQGSHSHPNAALTLTLDVASGPLWFFRHLSYAGLYYTGEIALGHLARPFTLGPLEIVYAEKIRCLAESVEVMHSSENERIYLRSHVAAETTPDTKLIFRGPSDAFAISWPSPTHPWANHYRPMPERDISGKNPERWKVTQKFLMMFSHQNSRKMETVRGSRWATKELAMRDEILELALRHGVIAKSEKYYVFNPEYRSLTRALEGHTDLTPESIRFLRDFIEPN